MSDLLAAAKDGFFGAFRMAWRIVTFNYFEVQRLRCDCGEAYQVVGYMLNELGPWADDDVIRALDNLSAAANGDPRPHSDLLPWPSDKALALRPASAGFVVSGG